MARIGSQTPRWITWRAYQCSVLFDYIDEASGWPRSSRQDCRSWVPRRKACSDFWGWGTSWRQELEFSFKGARQVVTWCTCSTGGQDAQPMAVLGLKSLRWLSSAHSVWYRCWEPWVLHHLWFPTVWGRKILRCCCPFGVLSHIVLQGWSVAWLQGLMHSRWGCLSSERKCHWELGGLSASPLLAPAYSGPWISGRSSRWSRSPGCQGRWSQLPGL